MTDETASTTTENEAATVGEPATPWTPPSTLSPPGVAPSGPPVAAVTLGVLAAVGCGVGLFVASQLLYVWIFYNLVIGGAIGAALGLAPRRAGFVSMPVLAGLAVALSIVPYVVMKLAFAVQLMPGLREQGIEVSYFDVVYALTEQRTIFGAEPGIIGNLVILAIEIGITAYAAIGRVTQAIALARIEAVPQDVLLFVANGLSAGWENDRMRTELAARGWSKTEDQDRAFSASFDLMSALQQQQAQPS